MRCLNRCGVDFSGDKGKLGIPLAMGASWDPPLAILLAASFPTVAPLGLMFVLVEKLVLVALGRGPLVIVLLGGLALAACRDTLP